ncbi:MAG: MBL fold metallo-hydrolase [Polyangia bacterium]|jgi:glyoxylase-like metal-dependent hydrolase (beta-lactamase superfamily II)|nr:MBL fold metallo-hydrolase [Polyangia bacterium]
MTSGSVDALYRRISLPTPFPVGPVNAYLIPGEPPALIDCGVKSSLSIGALEESLSEFGVRLESVGSIFLTHAHYDHSGAAVALGKRTGATIHYHAESPERPERSRGEFMEALRRYGAPDELVAMLSAMNQHGERFAEPLESAPRRALVADGQVFRAGGLKLRALHTPGHNAGHLCFLVEDAGVIFCGDLLLPTITPNPLPHFDAREKRGRRASLGLYLGSVARVESYGALLGLGGHGDPMGDTLEVARHARENIERRSEAVRALCLLHPGATVFSLAERLFQEKEGIGRVLAFTEVLAHCDLLEDRGELEVDHGAGRIVRLLG